MDEFLCSYYLVTSIKKFSLKSLCQGEKLHIFLFSKKLQPGGLGSKQSAWKCFLWLARCCQIFKSRRFYIKKNIFRASLGKSDWATQPPFPLWARTEWLLFCPFTTASLYSFRFVGDTWEDWNKYHIRLATNFIKEEHLYCTGGTEAKGMLERALGH